MVDALESEKKGMTRTRINDKPKESKKEQQSMCASESPVVPKMELNCKS